MVVEAVVEEELEPRLALIFSQALGLSFLASLFLTLSFSVPASGAPAF